MPVQFTIATHQAKYPAICAMCPHFKALINSSGAQSQDMEMCWAFENVGSVVHFLPWTLNIKGRSSTRKRSSPTPGYAFVYWLATKLRGWGMPHLNGQSSDSIYGHRTSICNPYINWLKVIGYTHKEQGISYATRHILWEIKVTNSGGHASPGISIAPDFPFWDPFSARTFACAELLPCGMSVCQQVSYVTMVSAPVSCFNVKAVGPLIGHEDVGQEWEGWDLHAQDVPERAGVKGTPHRWLSVRHWVFKHVHI